MTAHGVLAIDAGQTGMKVRLNDGAARDDVVFEGIHTHEALLPQLAAVVRAALEHTGGRPEIVTAGISGLTDRDADASALLHLLEGTGIRGAVLAHDSTTSFLGALGDARGVVVAAGTGVVTLAVGRASVARVDGWGYIMGDAGSGYWIGREALDAVMRAYDGRGPASSLTDVVRERWADLPQAYIALQAAPDRVRIVASFAAAVARAAADGDAVALDITERAAAELAQSATTALARVTDPDHAGERQYAGDSADAARAVCAIGGVFRSAPLVAAFDAALRRANIAGARVAARGEGIDGAMALADLSPQHPLSSAVHTSGAVRSPGAVAGVAGS